MRMNKRLIIEGKKVHYVGYRPFLLSKAMKLGIQKFEAENIVEDKKQKIIVSVSGEEKQIMEFVKCIRANYPPQARVSKVVEDTISPERVMRIEDYNRILAAEQRNTIVQAGLGMLDKQDQMLDKQDQMLDKQDQTINIIKQGNGKILEKQDCTIKAIEKLDADMNQKFDSLDNKYGEISKNLVRAVEGIEKLLERSEEDRQDFRDAIRELAEAIKSRS